MDAREVCRNRITTITTSASASSSVSITALIESRTKTVGSYTIWYVIPSGKFLLSSFIVARTSSDSSSAFAPGACAIGSATADSLLSRLRSEYWPAPSSMRATSFKVVTPPSGDVLRTMSPNSCSVIRRPEAVTLS